MQNTIHRSPGITAITNAVQRNKNNRILDLGSFSNANIHFFSTLGCQFHFENFDETIENIENLSQDQLNKAIDDLFNGLTEEKKFDIVLLWDLFNFIPLESIVKIMGKLEPYLKTNSLFYMITYTVSSRPSKPNTFKIIDKYQIQLFKNDSPSVKNQRITTASILKSLPKFSMLRSYLKQEGMAFDIAEQILCYQPSKSGKSSVFSSAELNQANKKVNYQYRSPTLEIIRSGKLPHRSLLDLGIQNTINADNWKQHFDDVYIDNLHILSQRFQNTPIADRKAFLKQQKYLSYEANKTFDIILLWDLPNFIDENVLSFVGKTLAKHSKNGTLLIINSYTGSTMPPQPQPFLLTSKAVGLSNDIHQQMKKDNTNPLNSFRIQKLFPGFSVKKAFFLKPGMPKNVTEYLFVFSKQQAMTGLINE